MQLFVFKADIIGSISAIRFFALINPFPKSVLSTLINYDTSK